MSSVYSTRRFYVGLDLGQRRDYTALVVLEKEFTPIWGDEWITAKPGETGHTRHMVKAAERIRLGTSYPVIVEWVKTIVTNHQLADNVILLVDATGVGAPVIDLLRAARLGCHIVPITITGSGTASFYKGVTTVPRTELLTNMQLMIQQESIEFSAHCSQLEALRKELSHLRLDNKAHGHHDDLSMALGLACWGVKGRY